MERPAAPARRQAASCRGPLAEFAGHPARERGLSPASVNSYLRHARPFLAGLDAPLATSLAGPSATQVTAFMTGHRGQWGTGTANATVTALRSLLRFLHATGRVPRPLASAVPPVAGWKLAPLPPGGLRFRRGLARAVHSPARQSTSPSSAAATSPAQSQPGRAADVAHDPGALPNQPEKALEGGRGLVTL